MWLGNGGLTASPATTSTPTTSSTPQTSLPPGNYPVDALLTGSCLGRFPDAWQPTYDVVSCATPHSAQVIRAGQVPGFAAGAFPGESAVQATVLPLCTELGVLEPSIAQAHPNVVITFHYPVTVAQWRESRGAFVCFAAESEGGPLTDSLVSSVG